PQHVLDGILAAWRATDAEAQPRKWRSPERPNYVAHPIVPAVAAIFAHAQQAQWQVQIVVNDDQVGWTAGVPTDERPHGAAREVHERLRLGEHHGRALVGAHGHQGVGFPPPEAEAMALGEAVE